MSGEELQVDGEGGGLQGGAAAWSVESGVGDDGLDGMAAWSVESGVDDDGLDGMAAWPVEPGVDDDGLDGISPLLEDVGVEGRLDVLGIEVVPKVHFSCTRRLHCVG